MGALSRNKGKTGEREIASILRGMTGLDVQRRVRQHDGDSDLVGIEGWSIEVKRAKQARIREWWEQTVEQARITDSSPVLFYRVDRGDWCAVFPLRLMIIDGDYRIPDSYEFTVTTSLWGWNEVRISLDDAEVTGLGRNRSSDD